MRTFTYPTNTPCEADWARRPLTELIAHLSQRYRRPTQERLEAVRSRFQEIRAGDGSLAPAHHRLASAFVALSKAIDEHVWLEDEVLCPAIMKAEYDPASDPGPREALCRIVVSVHDEHRRVRALVDALGRALGGITGPAWSTIDGLLAADLAMLPLLLHEQLDLEDRCLWPRALALFQE